MESKDNLERKIQQKMRKGDRKEHWRRTGKIAAACAAAVLVAAVSVPDIRAVATDFLHSTMGLQIAGVRDDNKEAFEKEQGFSFEWLMQFTEKEYWEWIQTHELTGGELPTYVPEGFRKVEDVYEYLYVENKDVSWSDEKISPKNQSTYGRFGRVSFPFLLSQEQKKKQVDDQAVLCGLSGTWLYVFGETTLTKIYVDCDEGQGKEFEEAENILVKVAENIRNPAYDANE